MKKIRNANKKQLQYIRRDLGYMDGVFVPNISYGMPVVKAIRNLSEKPLDVHLMIVHPEKYLVTDDDVASGVRGGGFGSTGK